MQFALDGTSLDTVRGTCIAGEKAMAFFEVTGSDEVIAKPGFAYMFDTRLKQHTTFLDERSVGILATVNTCDSVAAFLWGLGTVPKQRLVDISPWYQDPLACSRTLLDR
jgi:hypothetical protein